MFFRYLYGMLVFSFSGNNVLFFYQCLLKQVAQIIGKPDLAPAAWVRRLVTLCDQAPATSYDVVKLLIEKELDQSLDDTFERFDTYPLGSASIAQVVSVSFSLLDRLI